MQEGENFDVFVGKKFRFLRRQVKMSQEEIAKVINISYQQLQKYECGQNRFPLEKLLVALSYLNYPLNNFFEALLEPTKKLNLTHSIITIHKEKYETLLEVAKGVDALAEKVRRIVKVER